MVYCEEQKKQINLQQLKNVSLENDLTFNEIIDAFEEVLKTAVKNIFGGMWAWTNLGYIPKSCSGGCTLSV